MIRLLAALLIVAPLAPRANSACDTPQNDFDGLYCLNKIYQQADQDLNSAFGQLRPKLDTAGRASLKAGQLAWLRTRDSQCSKREGSAFYVNLQCATNTTIARTRFLQDRLRECVSSGCMNSHLGDAE